MVLEIADKLGDTYTNQNQFEKAEEILRKNLEAQGKPMSASLAKCYRQQGKTDKASEAYEQMLSQSTIKALSDTELLRSITGCALNDLKLNENKRAEKWFHEVIRLATTDIQQGKLKGEAYMELSKMYWNSGRPSESADAELNAFQTFEIVYGAEDPRTLSTGHNLARTYFTLQEWFKCEALYCKVIAGYETVYGPGNQHTNSARHCHSHALCYLGRDEEGQIGHTAAFYGLLAEPGIQDKFTQEIFDCLLGVYDSIYIPLKRMRLYQQVLPKVREALPASHPFRMKILRELARIYKEYCLYSDAEDLIRELIADEDNSDEYRHDLELLGEVLYEQDKSSEAKTVFHTLLDLRTKALGPYSPDTLDATVKSRDVHEELNKDAEADEIHLAYETALQAHMMERLRSTMESSRRKKSIPMN